MSGFKQLSIIFAVGFALGFGPSSVSFGASDPGLCQNVFTAGKPTLVSSPLKRWFEKSDSDTLETQSWFTGLKNAFGFGGKKSQIKTPEELRRRLESLLAKRNELMQVDATTRTISDLKHELELAVTDVLVSKGFKIEKDFDEGRPVLKIISGPEDQPIGKVIRRAKERFGVDFQIEPGLMDGSLGVFDPKHNRITLAAEMAMAEGGEVFPTLLHEIRHAYLHSLLLKRNRTPFQARFEGDEPLLAPVGYSKYFGFDELSTFARDFYYVRAGLKDLVFDEQISKDLKLERMASTVTYMSIVAKNMTKEALEILNRAPGQVIFQTDPNNGLLYADVPLANGDLGVYLVYAHPKSPTETKFQALKNQLELMHKAAKEFEDLFKEEWEMRKAAAK